MEKRGLERERENLRAGDRGEPLRMGMGQGWELPGSLGHGCVGTWGPSASLNFPGPKLGPEAAGSPARKGLHPVWK